MRSLRESDPDTRTVDITIIALCIFAGLATLFLAFHSDYLWAGVVALADVMLVWRGFGSD